MPLGFGPIASFPIAGQPSGGAVGAPIAINWQEDELTINWSKTAEIGVEWVDDTTLAITHEPGVEG